MTNFTPRYNASVASFVHSIPFFFTKIIVAQFVTLSDITVLESDVIVGLGFSLSYEDVARIWEGERKRVRERERVRESKTAIIETSKVIIHFQ